MRTIIVLIALFFTTVIIGRETSVKPGIKDKFLDAKPKVNRQISGPSRD